MTTRVTSCLAIILACCSARAADMLSDRCAVLAPSQGPTLLRQCSRRSPSDVAGFWSPSPTQVAAVEARLPAMLRTSGHKVALSQSYRQYVGIISHGKRLIYINAFGRFIIEQPYGQVTGGHVR